MGSSIILGRKRDVSGCTRQRMIHERIFLFLGYTEIGIDRCRRRIEGVGIVGDA